MRRSRAIAAGVLAATAWLAACSDDDPAGQGTRTEQEGGAGADEQGEAQPAPDASQFTEAATFEDVDLYPRSREASERTDDGEASVQTFVVRNATPEQIMEFFATTLPEKGWQVVEEPQLLGATNLRGAWVRGDVRLRVSTAPDPTLTDEGTGDDTVSQYSLVLEPID
jgi:hypothetical protein